MDFVTHAAVGALAGRAIAPSAPRAARWGALAALAPDVDHVLEWVSASAYLLQHRTWSHSFVAIALMIAASAIPERERRERTRVVAGSLATHLILDLSTPWGTGVGWPFTPAMPAWDVLPIVCPWLLVLSVGLAAFAWRRARSEPSQGGRAARWGLVLIAVFLAFEGAVAAHTRRLEGVVLAVPDWRFPWAGRGMRVEPGRVVIVDSGGEMVAQLPGNTQMGGTQDIEAWVARYRIPLQRPKTQDLIDAQFALVAPDRPPFQIQLDPPFLTMHPRGVQPLLWLAVVLVSVGLTRAPREAGPSGRAEPG